MNVEASEHAGSRSSELYHRRQLRAVARRWDAKAPAWDRELQDPSCHLNEDDSYARFLRCARLEIQQRADFCRHRGFIDAGCGTGLVLADLLPCFAWGIGVDISEGMIRVARGKQLERANFVVGDCFQLPSVCPPVGAVLSRGVLLSHYGLEHVANLMSAGREALIPGGFLIFDFLNADARMKHSHRPESKAYFTPEAIRHLGGIAGLKKIKIIGEPDRRVLLLVAERS